MSPGEMSSGQIEEIVAGYKVMLEEPKYGGDGWATTRQRWEGSLANYEKLLKERAEAGTYDTAGGVDQAHGYR